MMILHSLDKWWFLICGSLVLVLLFLLLLSFCIPGSLAQPVDILLAMFTFEIIVVASMVSQAVYYFIHNPDLEAVPSDF